MDVRPSFRSGLLSLFHNFNIPVLHFTIIPTFPSFHSSNFPFDANQKSSIVKLVRTDRQSQFNIRYSVLHSPLYQISHIKHRTSDIHSSIIPLFHSSTPLLIPQRLYRLNGCCSSGRDITGYQSCNNQNKCCTDGDTKIGFRVPEKLSLDVW